MLSTHTRMPQLRHLRRPPSRLMRCQIELLTHRPILCIMARLKQQLPKAQQRKEAQRKQQEAQWQQWQQWLKDEGLSDTPETFRELWAQFVKQQPHQEAELRRQEAQQRQEAQRKEGQQKQRQKKQRQKEKWQKEKWQAPPRRPRILSTEERQFNAKHGIVD